MAKIELPKGETHEVEGVSDSKSTMYCCTIEQAVELVRRQPAGTRFYVQISSDAPIEGQPGHIFPDAIHGAVKISRPEALDQAGKLLSKGLENRGARLRVRLYESTAGGARLYRALYLAS